MKRKSLLVALALPLFLLMLVAVIWLSLQSANMVNGAAALAAPFIGYRVRVDSISLSPGLQGRVSGLSLVPLTANGLSLSLAELEIKGNLKNVISAEVEKLVLKRPKLFFRLGAAGGKTDLSALEKLPPVRLLSIEDGEVDVSSGTTHVRLTGLRADVKNFSTASGGSARFEAAVDVSSPGDSGPAGVGRCSGTIDAAGPLGKARVKGSATLLLDSASFGSLSLNGFSLSSALELDSGRILLDPVSVNVASLVVADQERKVSVEGYAVDARVLYEIDSGKIALESVRGKAPGIGSFTAAYRGSVKGDVPWNASLEAPAVNFTQLYSMAKPFLPEDYRTWSVQGTGALDMKGEGSPAGIWKADVQLTFLEGGFKSADASKAGQSITGNVTLKLRSGPENKKTTFDLAMAASDGELLWGTYYKNFKGESIRFASQGSYNPDSVPFLSGSGSCDLFGTGEYEFSGQMAAEESSLKVSGKNLAHDRLFSILFKEYVGQSPTMISNLEIAGRSDFDVEARVKAGHTFLQGMLKVNDTSLNIRDLFSVSGLSLSLPFDLVYPWSAAPVESRPSGEALLTIRKLQQGSLLIENLDVPFILSRNNLRLLKGIDVKLYGGDIRVPRLEADNLLSEQATLSLTMLLERLDLGLLTRQLAGTEIAGTVNADFSGITYRREKWVTRGTLRTDVFGGSVELTNLFGENLFSQARKIGFDLFFRDIDLEMVTQKVALGKMTGIIRGSLANFVMEYGQPARFFLDIESDPTKKAPQLISVTAVENISVLGTGSGAISSVLNSGVHRFFKEYPYSRIGILCNLENDTFSVRGKIHEGGKEYLVRRGWLRGIDVIIQNPGNSSSFADMEERIGRIFRAKEKQGKVSQTVG